MRYGNERFELSRGRASQPLRLSLPAPPRRCSIPAPQMDRYVKRDTPHLRISEQVSLTSSRWNSVFENRLNTCQRSQIIQNPSEMMIRTGPPPR